jgi:sec-independent protein translocase protein TatC
VIFFLTKVGVLTPDFLRKYRKYALIGVLVLSAIITPPDIVSQIIVAIPVLILYEISIFISKFVYKRLQKEERENKNKLARKE